MNGAGSPWPPGLVKVTLRVFLPTYGEMTSYLILFICVLINVLIQLGLNWCVVIRYRSGAVNVNLRVTNECEFFVKRTGNTTEKDASRVHRSISVCKFKQNEHEIEKISMYNEFVANPQLLG